MKLYNVPENSMIVVLEENAKTPIAGYGVSKKDILKFCHIDGMYSYCVNENGETVHLAASTDVDIIKPMSVEIHDGY